MTEGNEKSPLEPCPKCGGEVVQAETLAGNTWLLLMKSRSAAALSLGLLRGTPVTARVCLACGYTELYATNPDVLK
ncbi:MAG: hypothetical protein M1401_10955 [Chloroflexi bacterium]|nr:hypothetical protein [Chloroflexota bacterium]